MGLYWLIFCDYGFSVSVLRCPLATPTILFGFLLPWTWGISSGLLQQSTAAVPYLRWGVSPHRRPFWPSTWDSFSRPSCARAATSPWMWGWCSRPPPLTSDLGSSSLPFLHRCSLALSAAAPDLGRGVTPLGCRPLGIGSSRLLPLTSDVGFGLLNLIWEPILCEACGLAWTTNWARIWQTEAKAS